MEIEKKVRSVDSLAISLTFYIYAAVADKIISTTEKILRS